MDKNIRKDVVIVGAGMIGLSLALALHQKGLQVAIIEVKNIIISPLNQERIETRVSAINKHSKKFLKDLGVWDSIQSNRISPYYKMQVWDEDIENNITIIAEEISEHSLGSIIENDVVIHALMERIRLTSIEILDNQEIIEMHRNRNLAKIILNNKIIETSLIVGADGINSFIRNYFNFEIKNRLYNHTSVVATLKLEKSHNYTAYQRFYDKGVLAFLPLENENKASIVWSVKSNYASHLMGLADELFEDILGLAISDQLGKVKLLSKKLSFELSECYPKTYVQDNVVLVGDACHSIHPLAGQGVNLGFKDVESLTQVLTRAFDKGRLIGVLSTLDKYQRDRQFDNQRMVLLMRILKECFGSGNKCTKWVRKWGLNFVDKNNFVKRVIVRQVL